MRVSDCGLVRALILSALAVGASLAAVEPLPRGSAVARVVAAEAPEQSYALYLPADYSEERTWPILYCFDPRGRGELCLERFRPAAERFGYIVASSNNSRSDGPMQPNIDAMKAMWKDTHARLAIDDGRVYATGFSGGARVATIMGQVLGLAGVIGCCGGFPPSSPPDERVGFAFYGMGGDLDFNYYEMRSLDRALDQLPIAHRFVTFPGGHKWAPVEVCTAALEWMELQAVKRGSPAPAPGFVAELFERGLEEGRALEADGRPADAWSRYDALVDDFDGLLDVSAAQRHADRLRSSKVVKRTLRERERQDGRAREYLDRLARVLERLRSADQPPPGRERLLAELQVASLLRAERERADVEEGRAARRLLEMVFVQTSFTQVQALRAEGMHGRAALALEIAVTIRPHDAVAWYNLACSQALDGAASAAQASLQRAVAAGFEDADLLRRDPDLRSLHGTPGFERLVRSLGS